MPDAKKQTAQILAKIDEPITLRFYYSERLGREIPSYGVYAQRVREMLEEYRDAARGKRRSQSDSVRARARDQHARRHQGPSAVKFVVL